MLGVRYTGGPIEIEPDSPSGPDLPTDLPEGVEQTNFMGVDYHHFKTEDGGDLFLTNFGVHSWRQLQPENWLVSILA